MQHCCKYITQNNFIFFLSCLVLVIINLYMLDMFKRKEPMRIEKITERIKRQEAIKNQELKKKVISSMKKDDELKKYVKDMQDLSNESFDILIKIIDRAYLKVKNK